GAVSATRNLRDFRRPLAPRVACRGPAVRRHRRAVRAARPDPARARIGALVRPADDVRGHPGNEPRRRRGGARSRQLGAWRGRHRRPHISGGVDRAPAEALTRIRRKEHRHGRRVDRYLRCQVPATTHLRRRVRRRVWRPPTLADTLVAAGDGRREPRRLGAPGRPGRRVPRAHVRGAVPGLQGAGAPVDLTTEAAFRVEQFRDFLALEAGDSAHTVANYVRDVRRLAEYAGSKGARRPEDVTSALLREFVYALKDLGLAPATIRRQISAVRTYYRYLVGEGHAARDPSERLESPRQWRRLPTV